MKVLLAPLQRLGNLIEAQNEKIEEIHSVLTVDLKKASKSNQKELSKQTVILTEIRDLLRLQSKQKKTSTFARMPKMLLPKLIGGVGIAFNIVAISAALVAAAGIFSVMPEVAMQQLFTAVGVAGVMMLIIPAFMKLQEKVSKFQSNFKGIKLSNGGWKEFGNKGLAGIANVGIAGAAILVMSALIVATSNILQYVIPLTWEQMGTALLISATFVVMTEAFVKIANALKNKGGQIVGKGKFGTSSFKDIFSSVSGIAIAMVFMAIATVATSFIFQHIMPVEAKQLATALAVAVIFVPLSVSFAAIAKGLNSGGKSKGWGQMGLTLVAMVGIALTTALIAIIWNKMMPDTFKGPDQEWVLNAGLAVMLFTIPFIGVLRAVKGRNIGDILLAGLAIPLIAVGILATAWIFSYLPDEYKYPEAGWAFGAAVAITLFAIPLAVIGAIAEATGGTAILLGAAGIILIAASMWVVAWIFSALPDLSGISQNFTDALMTPVNSIIDAFVRLKNEIGIENLVPLAGGLFAIAGGWLALTAAMAGQAAGGLYSSIANVGTSIFDGISKLLGGEAAKTPFDLLDAIANKSAEIVLLAKPFSTLGFVFERIGENGTQAIAAMASVLPFTERRKSDRLTDSANAMVKIGDAYEKISKASNSMNVSAIEASSRMFEAIAKIAENDGEDAMTVLAEELMKAVESLTEIVDNLDGTVNSQSNVFKGVIDKALDEFKTKIVGGSSEDGSSSDNGMLDMRLVVSAINDLEARFDRPIPVEDATAF